MSAGAQIDWQNDEGFKQLPLNEKHKALLAVDPGYKSLPPQEQQKALQVVHYGEKQEPSTYEKLTAPTDPGAHNPASRFLSSVGGLVMGAPEALYKQATTPMHSVTPEQIIEGKGPISMAVGAGETLKDWSKPATWAGAPSVLPEALGQGVGNLALGEAAPFAGKGLKAIGDTRGAISRAAYSGGQPRPIISAIGDALKHPTEIPGRAIVGAAKTMFPPPPEFSGAPLPSADEFYANKAADLMRRGREQNILDRKSQPPPELGSPENPGWMAKLPTRMPRQAATPPVRTSPFEGMTSSATPIGNAELPQGNATPFVGPRAEIPGITAKVGAPEVAKVADFPKPLRPLVGTPEEIAAYEQQMKILAPEAHDVGVYHAARGASGKKLNLQERIGRKIIE